MCCIFSGVSALSQFLLLPSPCPDLLKLRKGEEILRGGSAHQHQHLVDTWKFICCLGAGWLGMLGQHMPKSGGIILPFLGLNMNMAEHVLKKNVKPLASLAVTPQQWNIWKLCKTSSVRMNVCVMLQKLIRKHQSIPLVVEPHHKSII